MPGRRWFTLITLLLCAVATSSGAAGQGGPAPQPGERVRVRIVGPEPALIGMRCEGWVAAVAKDTIVLGQPRECPRGSHAAVLRVARGDCGSRLAHAGLGFLGGGLAGGIVGRVAAGDGCRISPCDDGEIAVVILTVGGAAAGAALGTLLGALLPAGPRWLTETVTRPLRVAGVEVHPGVQVSVGGHDGN